MIAISSILMVCMCSYEVIAGVCYRPIDRIKVILKNVKKKKLNFEFRISHLYRNIFLQNQYIGIHRLVPHLLKYKFLHFGMGCDDHTHQLYWREHPAKKSIFLIKGSFIYDVMHIWDFFCNPPPPFVTRKNCYFTHPYQERPKYTTPPPTCVRVVKGYYM